MADDKILEEALELFRASVEREMENRTAALDDIRFARLAEQWPAAIKKQREDARQPCLTINRLPTFIRQVVNDARQNKPGIAVHPVDDEADVETAKILSGLIRNIEYSSNAEVAYDTGLESAVTIGWGYWRVALDYAHDDSFDLELGIARISNPFSVYADPYSNGADSADWQTCFVTELIPRKAFEQRYPKSEAADWENSGYGQLTMPWRDADMILLAEFWKREQIERPIVLLSNGQVMALDQYQQLKDLLDAQQVTVKQERTARSWKVKQHLLTGAEVLESNDWPGRFIPIVPVYGEDVDVEGKRYLRSLVRDAKDPQRMLNYWRTNTTELVALAPRAPFIGPKGAFTTDAQKWATANTANHAYIEFDPVPGGGPPERQGFAGPPAGSIQEALQAADDIKSIIGMYDASLGARSNETSGRAILARQREGDVGTFHFIDNLSRAIRHTGRILVDLIPSVYTAPRIVRVLGEDKKPQIVKLGQPPDADAQEEAQEQQEGMAQLYDLSVGRYDVTVEAGPSYTTKREEAAVQMMELLRSYPAVAPLIGDLVAKNLDWPGADEIAERLHAALPPAIQQAGQGGSQGPNPQLQQAGQLIQQLQQQLAQLSQQLQQAKSDQAIEAQKLQIEAFNAETNRLKAMQPAMNTEQTKALIVQTMREVLGAAAPMPSPMMGTNGGMING